jgi:DNA-binding XRE family transcriptional regulator
MSSFSKWDKDAYRERVGVDKAAHRRGAIMAEQWGYQLAEERKRLGVTQAGLAKIMSVSPGRVSQIERGEIATVDAIAAYVSALGGKLDLLVDIGGHLLRMPTNPAA